MPEEARDNGPPPLRIEAYYGSVPSDENTRQKPDKAVAHYFLTYLSSLTIDD